MSVVESEILVESVSERVSDWEIDIDADRDIVLLTVVEVLREMDTVGVGGGVMVILSDSELVDVSEIDIVIDIVGVGGGVMVSVIVRDMVIDIVGVGGGVMVSVMDNDIVIDMVGVGGGVMVSVIERDIVMDTVGVGGGVTVSVIESDVVILSEVDTVRVLLLVREGVSESDNVTLAVVESEMESDWERVMVVDGLKRCRR